MGDKLNKEKKLLMDIEDICEKLNIKIRYERTKAKGGLCKLDGNNIIIIDKNANIHYKINLLISILSDFDLSNIHIKPKIRELLETEQN
jgi:galactitol-specific phosphotransferase system IIB component